MAGDNVVLACYTEGAPIYDSGVAYICLQDGLRRMLRNPKRLAHQSELCHRLRPPQFTVIGCSVMQSATLRLAIQDCLRAESDMEATLVKDLRRAGGIGRWSDAAFLMQTWPYHAKTSFLMQTWPYLAKTSLAKRLHHHVLVDDGRPR